MLELAHARLQEDWTDLRGLVEWACVLVRTDPPDEAERLWQRASLAVVEGAYDWRFLTTPPPPRRGEPPDPNLFGHSAHVRERFPDDGRFALAEAMILESAAPREAPFPRVVTPPPDRVGPRSGVLTLQQGLLRAQAAIDAYAMLLDDDDVGAEAALRAGYLEYRQGDPVAALELYTRADERAGDDRWVRYLARYLTARSKEREGAAADAESAYRRALEALPGAQSAALALAAWLVADGRPGAAYDVMESAGAVDPVPIDPWRTYGYGDLRHWPDLIVRLREAVRE